MARYISQKWPLSSSHLSSRIRVARLRATTDSTIMLRSLLLALLPFGWMLCHWGGAIAQTVPAPKPAPCSKAPHRQFDFWLGRWEVADPAGKVVGHNRIELAHDGCVLIEHWQSVAGVSGTSLNLYDRDRGKWHQSWVDSSGGLLLLDGGFADGAMVLTGESPDESGKPVLQRIAWRAQPDGIVRQLWESSNDGGGTWAVVFDGRYRKEPR